MSGKYLINVQILRFFAALLVVFAHAGSAVSESAAGAGATFDIYTPFDWGLGVDVFFTISGFIMYYLMHNRFQQPGAPIDFLRRRLVRIVPLYWICTTLTLASILMAGSLVNNSALDPAHIAASYAFIPWLRADGQPFPVLSLGWTLNYEMFFYIVFAVALCCSRRVGLTAVIVFFVSLMIASGLAPASLWLLKVWGNSMISEFLLGVGLAALHLNGRRLPWSAALFMVPAGFVLATAFYQAASYEYLGRLFTGGIPAILIAAAVVLAPPAGFGRGAKILALGGDASYALYLTHPFSTKIVAAIGGKLALPLPLTYVLAILASIAASVVVHLLVEKPVGAWLSQVTRRWTAANAAE